MTCAEASRQWKSPGSASAGSARRQRPPPTHFSCGKSIRKKSAASICKSRRQARGRQLLRIAPRQSRSDGARTFPTCSCDNWSARTADSRVTLADGQQMAIFDASQKYLAEGTPLVICGQRIRLRLVPDWCSEGPAPSRSARAIAEVTSAFTVRIWSAWSTAAAFSGGTECDAPS